MVWLLPKKGTRVNGKVIKSENARRLTGKSELQLELTSIIIDGTAHPIMTSGFQSKGGSEWKETLKKTRAARGWARPSVQSRATPEKARLLAQFQAWVSP